MSESDTETLYDEPDLVKTFKNLKVTEDMSKEQEAKTYQAETNEDKASEAKNNEDTANGAKNSEIKVSKQPNIGKRGREQVEKLAAAMEFEKLIAGYKTQGLTRMEIANRVKGYDYTEDYHFGDDPTYRRTKSMEIRRNAVGTSLGYSAYEWCGFDSDCQYILYSDLELL